MATQRPPLLTVQNLSRAVESHRLWHDLHFSIFMTERVAIVGPSGSGKTLLLRTLAGLEPLQEGSVTYRGKSIDSWSMPMYRAQVMYLAQRALLPDGTVEAVLREPFGLQVHRHRTFERRKVLTHLDALGRDATFLAKHTSTLSGGEAQITSFIRAIQLEPSILLLDEPTASLDEETSRHLEMLVEVWLEQERHRACVWTSHNAAQLARVTDRQFELKGPA